MKASSAKLAAAPQTPVFPQTLHRVRQRGKAATPISKSQKRDNVFQNPVTRAKIAVRAG
jgi:hypothetical protein